MTGTFKESKDCETDTSHINPHCSVRKLCKFFEHFQALFKYLQYFSWALSAEYFVFIIPYHLLKLVTRLSQECNHYTRVLIENLSTHATKINYHCLAFWNSHSKEGYFSSQLLKNQKKKKKKKKETVLALSLRKPSVRVKLHYSGD